VGHAEIEEEGVQLGACEHGEGALRARASPGEDSRTGQKVS
jgi:hypothetical protein